MLVTAPVYSCRMNEYISIRSIQEKQLSKRHETSTGMRQSIPMAEDDTAVQHQPQRSPFGGEDRTL